MTETTLREAVKDYDTKEICIFFRTEGLPNGKEALELCLSCASSAVAVQRRASTFASRLNARFGGSIYTRWNGPNVTVVLRF